MKYSILIFLAFFVTNSVVGQSITCNWYATTLQLENYIALMLYSNNKYELKSIWKVEECPECLPKDNVEGNSIYWSEGEYTQHNDTIVCVDKRDHRMIRLVEIDTFGVLKIIDSSGFSDKSLKRNYHKGWMNDTNRIVFVGDLLKKTPLFYIYIMHIREQGETVVLTRYEWKNGKRRLIHSLRPRKERKEEKPYKAPWLK